MKIIAVILLLATVVVALPFPQNDVVITRSEFENNGDSYNWVSELSDGSTHQQAGELKDIGSEKGISMTGSYSFVGEDGITYTVNYVADENGFQPSGDHIPKADQPQGQGSPVLQAPAMRYKPKSG